MAQFNQNNFNKFVIDNGVIGFFENPVVLKSGRQSNWYVNWRTVSEDVFLMDQLSEYVLNFAGDLISAGEISDSEICYYGVPEGATKLGLLVQYKYASRAPGYGKGSHVFPMGRAKPKEHGDPKDKFFVGAPKGNLIVLEDVTTTGGSLIETIIKLVEAGITVSACIGLTNRMEKRDDGRSVKSAIESIQSTDGKNIKYFQMSDALSILPEVVSRLNPSLKIQNSIEEEFKKYGLSELSLAKK
jgi:orotate phosphoribosyltransferase